MQVFGKFRATDFFNCLLLQKIEFNRYTKKSLSDYEYLKKRFVVLIFCNTQPKGLKAPKQVQRLQQLERQKAQLAVRK